MVKGSKELFDGAHIESYVECNLCGYKSQEIGLHLKNVHGISAEIYGKPTKSKDMCDRVRGDKNPAYNHGGRLSPWSLKSEYHTKEQVEECRKVSLEKARANENWSAHTTTLDFYLNKGMSEDDAKAAQSERQTTFSLEKCQEKHGMLEGFAVWQDRQDSWQDTLKAKPEEEMREINKRKVWRNGKTSKTELELLLEIQKQLEVNSQFMIANERSYYFFDIALGNKLIEFNGDYWHANPNKYKDENKIIYRDRTAKVIWDRDEKKINTANENGYEVLTIWESDFKKNKDEVIARCITFLTK
jgi:G:T-mismatch repair DNA endonuclease (very short patch repair protein)